MSQYLCRAKDCNDYASFGLPNTWMKQYCQNHKSQEHIELPDNMCDYPDCKEISFYLEKHDLSKKYCRLHRTKDWIYLHTKCIMMNCFNDASYCDPEIKINDYCIDHVVPGYIYGAKSKKPINLNKCMVITCKQYAVFGFSTNRKIYCTNHKKPDMIHLRKKLEFKNNLIDNINKSSDESSDKSSNDSSNDFSDKSSDKSTNESSNKKVSDDCYTDEYYIVSDIIKRMKPEIPHVELNTSTNKSESYSKQLHHTVVRPKPYSRK